MEDFKAALKDMDKRIGSVTRTAQANSGELVYLENRATLEKDHTGEYVVIDAERRKIVEYGKTPTSALKNAIEKSGKKKFYLRRVGRPTRLRV